MLQVDKSPLHEYKRYLAGKGRHIPEPFHTTRDIIAILLDPAITQKMADDEVFSKFMQTKIYYVQEEPKAKELLELIEQYYTQETSFIYNVLVDMYLCFLSVSDRLTTKEIEGFRNAMTSNTKTGERITDLLNKRQQSISFCIEQKIYPAAA